MKKLSLLLFCTLTFSVAVNAADRERERGGFGKRPGGDRGAMFEKLGPEAQKAMREMFMEMRESGGDLQRRNMKLRQELQGLVMSGKVDEDAIRAKVKEVSEIEVEMTILRARAIAKLKESGVSEETLRMIAGRMGGGPPGGRGGPGMEGRGRERGESGQRPREGGRRPAPEEGDQKGRRPEFDF